MSAWLGVGRLARQDVEPGRGDAALAHGVVERVEIDDRAPCGVDQNQARLCRPERRPTDEPARLLGGRRVDAHHVGHRHQSFKRRATLGVDRDLVAGGQERIVEGDPHAEAARPRRRRQADATEPDDAEDLAAQPHRPSARRSSARFATGSARSFS